MKTKIPPPAITLISISLIFLTKPLFSSYQILFNLEIGTGACLIGLLILIFSALGYGNFSIISILLVFVIAVNFGVESMMEKQSGSIPIVWLLCFLTSGKSIFKSVFKF